VSLALTSRRAALLPGRWVSNELWRRARAVPSLDLRFAESKSLVDSVSGQILITFTRASTGTFVDSDGVIRSAGNDVPRFYHNPVTGECLGLLVEEQRQNLLLNSATLSTQTVTVTAAAHTLSFNGTGTVTLTGTSTAGPLVGTGANARVSLTFTPTAGSLTLTVSGSVTNANLELGSFSTSWIPTTGTAATRTADVVSIGPGVNLTSWFTSFSENTFYIEYNRPPGTGQLIEGVDGSNAVGISLTATSTLPRAIFRYGSSRLDTSTAGLPVYLPSTNKLAASTSASGPGVASNGTLSTGGITPAQADWTASSAVGIGRRGAFNNEYPNTTIRRLAFWPTRLPNSTLQSITQ
jgi:hypothetical protein